MKAGSKPEFDASYHHWKRVNMKLASTRDLAESLASLASACNDPGGVLPKRKTTIFIAASFASVLPLANSGVCSFLAITKIISPPPPVSTVCLHLNILHLFCLSSSFATFPVAFCFPSWSCLCLTQSHSQPFRPFFPCFSTFGGKGLYFFAPVVKLLTMIISMGRICQKLQPS